MDLIPKPPQPRNGCERRYAKRLRKRHQQHIRHQVWQRRSHGSLTRAQRDCGLVLADFAGLDGGCFPSYVTIAKRVGCHPRTVGRALPELAKLGIIRWTRRKVMGSGGSDDHQTSNLYRFPGLPPDRPFVDHEAVASRTPVLLSESEKNLESDSTDIAQRRSKLGPKYLTPEQLDLLNPLPNGRKRAREGPR